jgi:biotin transporter BioY
MVSNQIPEEKPLQAASFAIHAARGVIRDQRTRRWVMVTLLGVAMVQNILGITVLNEVLSPHVRPFWFTGYWFICAWLTITAILLAMFDLLLVRSEERKARRNLREQMERASSSSVEPLNR